MTQTQIVAVVVFLLAVVVAAYAQETPGADPVYWCDVSRSQISHERDIALAQIERLKLANAQLSAKIKTLEKPTEKPAETPQ
jgi:hypothetical protein